MARFFRVFGINTASDISKFTKISRAAAAASDIKGVLQYHEPIFNPNTPKKPCCFLFILRGKEISHIMIEKMPIHADANLVKYYKNIHCQSGNFRGKFLAKNRNRKPKNRILFFKCCVEKSYRKQVLLHFKRIHELRPVP